MFEECSREVNSCPLRGVIDARLLSDCRCPQDACFRPEEKSQDNITGGFLFSAPENQLPPKENNKIYFKFHPALNARSLTPVTSTNQQIFKPTPPPTHNLRGREDGGGAQRGGEGRKQRKEGDQDSYNGGKMESLAPQNDSLYPFLRPTNGGSDAHPFLLTAAINGVFADPRSRKRPSGRHGKRGTYARYHGPGH